MNYFKKFVGKKTKIEQNHKIASIVFASIGGFLAIACVGFLSENSHNLLVMGSFGASCVLIFGFAASPFSQPRNVIFGHFISTFIGLLFLHFVGSEWWSMAAALAFCIFVMMLTKTVHPPAGSNPIIVFLLGANWDYLFFPTLFGAIILVLVALIFNNLSKEKIYPVYWL